MKSMIAPRVLLEPEVAPARASDDWRLARFARPDEYITPLFMLRHDEQRIATLEETLMAVSDPSSTKYGQHLTSTQTHALLEPPDGNAARVISWLRRAGANVTVASPDLLSASMTVDIAESLLGTRFAVFSHKKAASVSVHRVSAPYSLPADIAPAVTVVGNVLYLPAVRTSRRAAGSRQPSLLRAREPAATHATWNASCRRCSASSVTPAVLAARYSFALSPADDGFAPSQIHTQPKKGTSRMATAEFQGQDWTQPSLDAFSEACGLPPMHVAKQIGTHGDFPGLEASLDIEYMAAVGGPDIPLTNIYNDKYALEAWAAQLANMSDATIPHVVSVSYGNDERQQPSGAFMRAVNAQFMALGARGVTLLVASGDQGVYGRTGPGIFKRAPFHPDFPADSPFVTAVGGTDFETATTLGPEVGWSGSGGGFSNVFARPAYQREAVERYLAEAAKAGVLPPSHLYNASGSSRAYPDISALGGEQNGYCVFVTHYKPPRTDVYELAGTSAATPVVGALIARLNVIRLARRQPVLGFLNPWLYAKGVHGLMDVTLGGNPGKGPHGFRALAGWDPVTGLGSPNFTALAAIV